MAGMSPPPSGWQDLDGDGLLELLRERGIDISEIDAEVVSASEQVGNATYATLEGVPTTLPGGAQVYVQDEDRIYVEDGT